MKCSKCGAELSEGEKFYAACGAKVETAKFCAACGAKLKAGLPFGGMAGASAISLTIRGIWYIVIAMNIVYQSDSVKSVKPLYIFTPPSHTIFR